MNLRPLTSAAGLLPLLMCLAALVFCPRTARAQTAATDLDTALELFRVGQWETAIAAFESQIRDGHLQGPDLTQARKHLAICHILFEAPDKARALFKQIIRQDPSFAAFDFENDLKTADGELIEEVVRIFSQSVMEVRQEDLQARQTRLSRTSRLGALLRSATLPGWGQRYQGHAQRGYWILGSAVASMAYAVTAERSLRQARDAYGTDRIDADFDRLYQDYRDRGNRADQAWRLLGAVWLVNVLDAVSQGPNLEDSPGFSALPDYDGFRIVLKTRF